MGKGKRKYEPEKRELTNLISLVRRFRKSPLQSQEVFERLLEYQKNIQNRVMEYIITGQNYNINTNTVKATLNYMAGPFSEIVRQYKGMVTIPGNNRFYKFTLLHQG
jgi:capsid portal protein